MYPATAAAPPTATPQEEPHQQGNRGSNSTKTISITEDDDLQLNTQRETTKSGDTLDNLHSQIKVEFTHCDAPTLKDLRGCFANAIDLGVEVSNDTIRVPFNYRAAALKEGDNDEGELPTVGTGVMLLKGECQAVVDAPEQSTSKYSDKITKMQPSDQKEENKNNKFAQITDGIENVFVQKDGPTESVYKLIPIDFGSSDEGTVFQPTQVSERNPFRGRINNCVRPPKEHRASRGKKSSPRPLESAYKLIPIDFGSSDEGTVVQPAQVSELKPSRGCFNNCTRSPKEHRGPRGKKSSQQRNKSSRRHLEYVHTSTNDVLQSNDKGTAFQTGKLTEHNPFRGWINTCEPPPKEHRVSRGKKSSRHHLESVYTHTQNDFQSSEEGTAFQPAQVTEPNSFRGWNSTCECPPKEYCGTRSKKSSRHHLQSVYTLTQTVIQSNHEGTVFQPVQATEQNPFRGLVNTCERPLKEHRRSRSKKSSRRHSESVYTPTKYDLQTSAEGTAFQRGKLTEPYPFRGWINTCERPPKEHRETCSKKSSRRHLKYVYTPTKNDLQTSAEGTALQRGKLTEPYPFRGWIKTCERPPKEHRGSRSKKSSRRHLESVYTPTKMDLQSSDEDTVFQPAQVLETDSSRAWINNCARPAKEHRGPRRKKSSRHHLESVYTPTKIDLQSSAESAAFKRGNFTEHNPFRRWINTCELPPKEHRVSRGKKSSRHHLEPVHTLTQKDLQSSDEDTVFQPAQVLETDSSRAWINNCARPAKEHRGPRRKKSSRHHLESVYTPTKIDLQSSAESAAFKRGNFTEHNPFRRWINTCELSPKEHRVSRGKKSSRHHLEPVHTLTQKDLQSSDEDTVFQPAQVLETDSSRAWINNCARPAKEHRGPRRKKSSRHHLESVYTPTKIDLQSSAESAAFKWGNFTEHNPFRRWINTCELPPKEHRGSRGKKSSRHHLEPVDTPTKNDIQSSDEGTVSQPAQVTESNPFRGWVKTSERPEKEHSGSRDRKSSRRKWEPSDIPNQNDVSNIFEPPPFKNSRRSRACSNIRCLLRSAEEHNRTRSIISGRCQLPVVATKHNSSLDKSERRQTERLDGFSSRC